MNRAKIRWMDRREPYHHGDLRAALVREALTAIETDGIEAVQLRGLAKQIGVAHPAVYRHFPDREALLRAALAQAYGDLARQLSEPVGAGAPPDLFDLAAKYAAFAQHSPNLFLAMSGPRLNVEANDAGLEASLEASFAPVVSAVENLQAKGLAGPQDPKALAVFFWASLQGVLAQVAHRRIGVRDDLLVGYVRDVVRRLLSGLSIADSQAETSDRTLSGFSTSGK